MSDITTENDNFARNPPCKLCDKQIWGIAKITFTVGTEKPTLLHTVCYERICENAGMDKQ